MSNSSMVCVDANLVFRLLTDPDDRQARQFWQRWGDERRPLAAPILLRYEVANALHRVRRAGLLNTRLVSSALQAMFEMPLQLYADPGLLSSALAIAERLAPSAAYDAHYLALAEQLGAEFWTADARLADSVRSALTWVRLLGEPADTGA